jgi:hypothetical protein
MIRLLAPHRDIDWTALDVGLIDVNEVDAGPDDVDDRTPEGHWLAGYFPDDTPVSAEGWCKTVAQAPVRAVDLQPSADIDELRAKVAAATTVAALRTATLGYLDAITP